MAEESWSPHIDVGASVLIPETYVPDLDVRLSLYRRVAALEDQRAVNDFAEELADRFGPLPEPVESLLSVVVMKQLCRSAGVDRVDAGASGAVVAFRGNRFANPVGLVDFLQRHRYAARLRPDQKLVVKREWSSPRQRFSELAEILRDLSAIAAAKP